MSGSRKLDYQKELGALLAWVKVPEIKDIIRGIRTLSSLSRDVETHLAGNKAELVQRVIRNYRFFIDNADPAILLLLNSLIEEAIYIRLADVQAIPYAMNPLPNLRRLRAEAASPSSSISPSSTPLSTTPFGGELPGLSQSDGRSSTPGSNDQANRLLLPGPRDIINCMPRTNPARSSSSPSFSSYSVPRATSSGLLSPPPISPLPSSALLSHPASTNQSTPQYPAPYRPFPSTTCSTPVAPNSLLALATQASTTASAPSHSTSRPQPLQNLRYRPSPFISVVEALGRPYPCGESPNRYASCQAYFKLTPKQEGELKLTKAQPGRDPGFNIYLLMTSHDQALASFNPAHPGVSAEFPRFSSVKFNGVSVPAAVLNRHNLKTKQVYPIDMTPHYTPGYSTNRVEITYASTKRMVAVMLYCRQTQIPSLLAELQQLRSRSLDTIRDAAEDDDIAATSNVLSLKCPLSHTRIKYPCRTTKCQHLQCFDADSFLRVNQQSPTWKCPVCNCDAQFADLFMDGFSQDILNRVDSSIDQIHVETDMTWHMPEAVDSVTIGDDDDDDDYDSDDGQYPRLQHPASHRNTPMGNLPGHASTLASPGTPLTAQNEARPDKRDAHPSPHGSRSISNNKRPRVEVIDLTLSDSEPEEAASAVPTPSANPRLHFNAPPLYPTLMPPNPSVSPTPVPIHHAPDHDDLEYGGLSPSPHDSPEASREAPPPPPSAAPSSTGAPYPPTSNDSYSPYSATNYRAHYPEVSTARHG
ncbi:hypothetical protein BJ085DRAFT_33007 [Dimargaris cristalligena]|uniref:PINIT domain-containing protein n=1 Tax=Dimargaris cristalligena TaxID=215637 RepID=A0A4P9ZT50_9FUNG|nr:hypothetical protein BJ085DRAFT_33007 [Dimargaris cristalligena]|eukprot:RKP36001.1 hypothetical protein BJ085DRAFT_33007 [Dimargaris cristalligena]